MPPQPAKSLPIILSALAARDIPPKLIDDAKTLVLDYLGVALAGSQTDSGRISARFVVETGGQPEATLIGDGRRVPAVHAALANAISSHSVELDDVDVLALFHFSPPVVSAALAVAERERSSGTEFIAAVAAGCEMMARASAATNPSLRDRGFHTTPTCGVFGATIAAARLLKLDRDDDRVGAGARRRAGVGADGDVRPVDAEALQPGPERAQRRDRGADGASSASPAPPRSSMASAASAAPSAIEFDLAELTKGLGTDFPVYMEFKPYSCARPIHNAIDCALNIRKELRRAAVAGARDHGAAPSGLGALSSERRAARPITKRRSACRTRWRSR